MSFDHLGLTPELVRVVADEGYEQPTPVQAEAIPLILSGRDVLAGAQTGTGKTAAFVLPILQHLHRDAAAGSMDRRERDGRPAAGMAAPGSAATHGDRGRRTVRPIRVLVLTPTRELALQVEESIRTYGARRPVRSTPIYGGVGFDPQVRALRAGPDVVVATPGRLLDHAAQGTIDLSRVEILVLDEADRMLDMGFIRDIRRILYLLPARRQSLLFSATFSNEIRALAEDLLDSPAHVQVTPRNTAAELVDQLVFPVERTRKRAMLSHLVRTRRIEQALVFTRTKHGASRLAEQLQRDGIAATAIHGNKSQSQRVRALEDFKAGRSTVLVATDVAARGLDIDALPHVVNFELPAAPEDYVHRIGRTGRAGSTGEAISLVSAEETPLLRDIERLLRRPIRSEAVPGFDTPILSEAAPGQAGWAQRGPSAGGGARPAAGRGGGGDRRWGSRTGQARDTRGGSPAPGSDRTASGRRPEPAHRFVTMPGERLARHGSRPVEA